jgi:hypothetical protein
LGTLSLTRQPFAGPRVNFWLSTGNIGKERAIELGRVRHTIHTVSARASPTNRCRILIDHAAGNPTTGVSCRIGHVVILAVVDWAWLYRS